MGGGPGAARCHKTKTGLLGSVAVAVDVVGPGLGVVQHRRAEEVQQLSLVTPGGDPVLVVVALLQLGEEGLDLVAGAEVGLEALGAYASGMTRCAARASSS